MPFKILAGIFVAAGLFAQQNGNQPATLTPNINVGGTNSFGVLIPSSGAMLAAAGIVTTPQTVTTGSPGLTLFQLNTSDSSTYGPFLFGSIGFRTLQQLQKSEPPKPKSVEAK